MHLGNLYYYFTKALTPEQCQRILDIGINQLEKEKKEGKSTSGTTFAGSQKDKVKDGVPIEDKSLEDLNLQTDLEKRKKTYTRDSEVTWLNEPWLYDLLGNFLHKANNDAGWKYDVDFSESIQFTKYGLNQFYGWHTDGGSCHLGTYKRFIPGVTPVNENGKPEMVYTENSDMIGKVRKLSMTVNLVPEGSYKGGNLKFDFGPHAARERFHECTEIRPQGSLIVFPSFVHHQVTPVTEGTRYSLVMWSLGKPFR